MLHAIGSRTKTELLKHIPVIRRSRLKVVMALFHFKMQNIKKLGLYHEYVALNTNTKYKMGFYGRMPHIFDKFCDGSKGIKRGGNHGDDTFCNE